MRHFLIRLKKISLFNYFLLILTIFTFFYANNYIKRLNYSSKYKVDSKNIQGYIKDKKRSEDKITYYIDDLILYDYKMDIEYEIGDYVLIKGKIKIPDKNTLPNLFNYKLYLYSLNIHYIVSIEDIKRIDKKPPLLYLFKRKLKNYLCKYHKKEYMLTFILGDNSNISNDVKNSYSINGISHLFSLSGMHVTIISLILLFLLKKLFKEKYSLMIVYVFFLFFLFLTGFLKSIIRATFLFFIVTIRNHFKLKISVIKVLYVFFLIMILINPYNIFNVSFKFSYIVTFYLILFSKIISNQKNYFVKLFLTSLISNLASIPIVSNNYFQINLFTCFLNIIFVPLVTFIVFPFSLIVLFIKPLEFLLIFFIKILEKLSLFFMKYKMIVIIPNMSVFCIIMYYLLITFILYKIKNKEYIYIFLIVLFLFIHINNYKYKKSITFIDVKQGDSTLININGKAILIDTGGVKNYEIVNNQTIPYMKSLGITKISALILTHADFDHMGEAQKIVSNFKVEKVIFNCGEYNELEKELIKVLIKKKISYYSCIKELNIDNNKLYFLQTKEYDNENDNSNVIYIEIDGYKFLFMGDAGVDKEKDILEKYNITNIDVLKVGHHGSKTSSGKEFIDEINPKYSIISVGKNNRYGHPNKEVLNNLEGSKIYRTDKNGSIMFKIKNNKLYIEKCI